MSIGIGRSSWSSSRGATDRIAASPRPMPFGRSATRSHLLGQLEVRVGAGAVRIVVNDWFTETWCFADADVARDDRVDHQLWKVLSDLSLDVLGEASAAVVHGQKHPSHSKPWIELALDE